MNHLNEVKLKSNMYQDFITDTWNPVAGACAHKCSYCQVQKNKLRFPHLNKKYSGKPRFEQSYLKDNLESGHFIFVCNQQDLFAVGNDMNIIHDVLGVCNNYDNKYFFQTKNPIRFHEYLKFGCMPRKSEIGTTLETNRNYFDIIQNAPTPTNRALSMEKVDIEKYVTIEPIIDFDLIPFIDIIKRCSPKAVFIGADSKNCNLPEPSSGNILSLINEIDKFSKVIIKDNLKRLVKV